MKKTDKVSEDKRWQKIYKRGRRIGKLLNIKSEKDIDDILHSRRESEK